MADRDGIWFLALTAVYLAAQAIQRILLGGTLEVDEAEMLLMSQTWALGYGPQLPLYNWAQVLVFQVLGPGTAGLAVLKATVLWLAAAGMWFAMRAAFADRRAALAAALSLAFLPNVIWEFQRASSHSIAMLAAITWTLWAWFTVLARPSLRNWLVLGLIMGLGGLSKANYWAVPLGLGLASLGYWPRGRGVVLALAVAAGIVAVPYAWAVLHPVESLASVGKFYLAEPVLWPWVSGLAQLAGGLLAGLVLVLAMGGALWVTARGRLGPMPTATHILIRAAAITLAAAVVLVVVTGATTVQARWLVPVLVFLAAAGFGWLAPALSDRAFRAVPIGAAVLALVTVGGMAQLRLTPGNTATLDFRPVLDLINRANPPRIMGDYFAAGNLRLLAPERDIGPLGDVGPDAVLVLGALPKGAIVQDGGVLTLTYLGKPDKKYLLDWHMLVPEPAR